LSTGDIETGTQSAAVGGFTSIACMPNTNPVIDNDSVVNNIINRAKQDGFGKCKSHRFNYKGQAGKELSNSEN
jgi:dihydroorotase